MYDAALIREAVLHQTVDGEGIATLSASGCAMASDHRRIVATGLSRLRGKLKYRPVIFELMPERFYPAGVAEVTGSLSGLSLHKQNFRRALERTGFVRPSGLMRVDTGGRPAELYSYNRDQFHFSPSLGLSLPRT